MKYDVIQLNTNQNVTLSTYLLEPSHEMSNAKVRPAVVIFPGGGYRMVSDREAEPVAMAFLNQGYHAFVLRYSIRENAAFPKPLNDAEDALELVRANAIKWGVDPGKIAVCGFSAGGHLAAALGTMGRVRPNLLILGYATVLERAIGNTTSHVPSLVELVDQYTPPAFIFATANDSLVPVENSLKFAAALDKAKVPFELHVFQEGMHGLSLAKDHTANGNPGMINPAVATWMGLCLTWLEKHFGLFPLDNDLKDMPEVSTAQEYSIDVPLKVCWTNPQAKQVIMAAIPGLENSPDLHIALSLSLCGINLYAKTLNQDQLTEIDRTLKEMPFDGIMSLAT